jgi:biotin carboxylase
MKQPINQPWVVHVGAGTWQSSAILSMRGFGFRTLAVDGSALSAGFKLADEHLVVDISRPDAVETAVREFFFERNTAPVAVVCTACEVGMLSAANLRDRYGLPGTGLALARRLTNKGAQRRAWVDLASPRFVVLSDPFENIHSHITELRTEKVIIKPIDSSGSRGISVVARSFIVPEQLKRASQLSSNGEIIIEEFIEGREYAVESIRLSGLSYPILVTYKDKVVDTNSTVANLLKTASLTSFQENQIRHLLASAHDALSYDNGVCHTEIIEDMEGHFWLVETAGRGAGFGVSEHFIKYATGYDYFETSLRFDLGMQISMPSPSLPLMISAVRFIETIPGRFISIKNESNVAIQQLISSGELMSAPETDGDRVGYFYVNGASSQIVNTKINETLSKIFIQVD